MKTSFHSRRGSPGAWFEVTIVGCDFSHGDLRMSYRGFNSLLQKLADEAEITLRDTERHAINVSSECVDEPLLLLLNGFDEYGGGEIASTACLQLSRRLRYIADKWADRCHKYHDWHDECASLAHAIGEAAFLGEKFYWF